LAGLKAPDRGDAGTEAGKPVVVIRVEGRKDMTKRAVRRRRDITTEVMIVTSERTQGR
jgi:hypothetical protein